MPPRTRSGTHLEEPKDIDSPAPPMEPLEEPTPDPPDQPPADLAQAITLLANSLSAPKKPSARTKVREPIPSTDQTARRNRANADALAQPRRLVISGGLPSCLAVMSLRLR
jgi:hypothetical protein